MSGRSKNHTLKGGTSPYSLSMGVPLPGAGGSSDWAEISTIAAQLALDETNLSVQMLRIVIYLFMPLSS